MEVAGHSIRRWSPFSDSNRTPLQLPKTRVALYREEDESCPFIEWFDKLPAKVQDKCYLRLERLREMGHELRRPEADFLRDRIYELRVERKKQFEANPAQHTYDEA